MTDLLIDSSRLGQTTVDGADVLDVPDGLVGLPGRRWAVLRPERGAPFAWLQSVEDPDLAVPVVSPWVFFPAFELVLSDAEAERLGVEGPEDAEVLVVVRAAPRPEDCHANLRAPVLVAHGRAHQVLNEAPGAEVRAPLFSDEPADAAPC